MVLNKDILLLRLILPIVIVIQKTMFSVGGIQMIN
jgi:hypothetical protein